MKIRGAIGILVLLSFPALSNAGLMDDLHLVQSVRSSIRESVGAKKDSDAEIPGSSRTVGQNVLGTIGVECPAGVADVPQAVALIEKGLSSNFGDSLKDLRVHPYPPGSDVVISGRIWGKVSLVDISISVFKRSSSRVFLFAVLVSTSTQEEAPPKQ